MRTSFLLLALVACAFVAVSARPTIDLSASAQLTDLAQEREANLLDGAAWPQGEFLETEGGNMTAANGWTLYRQCGQKWSNNILGTSKITICQAGCAMSSVAMALKTRGVNVDPGTLNTWLKSHGGYVSGNLLVWGSVNAFGKLKLSNYYHGYGSLSQANLRTLIKNGWAVVVNVKNGGHWVLVTGYVSGNKYTVNDPGYASVNSYEYGAMGNFVVYA